MMIKMQMSNKLTKKEELRRRRKMVAELMPFYSQSEIADRLGISRPTAARDIGFLKQTALDWADDLPRGGYILNIKHILGKLSLLCNVLEGELRETDDVMQKASIIEKLGKLFVMQAQILNGSPIIYALRKAFDQVNVQES